MKHIKLYNVIFPIWFILFFPPVIFVTLLGNFIIDSLVVIACFYVYKLANKEIKLKTFYKKSILKVWIFGFIADILGAVFLFFVEASGYTLGLPNKVITGIDYDPYISIWSVIIIILAMLISVAFIFILNYYNTFHNQLEELKLRFKVALTIAIVTIPWTFLLPTKWFYHTL